MVEGPLYLLEHFRLGDIQWKIFFFSSFAFIVISVCQVLVYAILAIFRSLKRKWRICFTETLERQRKVIR